ncbi:MAG TPA: hypothetical protein VGF99_12080 [Myxococcota bacterium]
MHAPLLALALATMPPAPPASSTSTEPTTTTTSTTPETTTTTSTTSTTEPAIAPVVPVDHRGPVGVGLLAAGASLAAGGTVAFTFIEVAGTQDRASNPPSANVERFTTIGGFLGVAVASVSAVLMVIGASLTLSSAGAADTAPPT